MLYKEANELQTDYLQSVYDKSDTVYKFFYEDDNIPKEFISFHAQNIYMVTADDSYLCGLRADHFCIECGWNEITKGKWYIVTANNKGLRCSVMFKESNDTND